MGAVVGVSRIVAAVAAICFREYGDLVSLHGIEKPGVFGYVAGLLLLLLPGKDFAFLVLVAILAMALALRSREMAEALPAAASLLLGVVYVFGSLRCGIDLHAISIIGSSSRYRSTGRATLPLCMWDGVSAATRWPRREPGKIVGRRRASTVASVIYGAIYFPRLLPTVPLLEAFGLDGVANIAGQFGDLCESA